LRHVRLTDVLGTRGHEMKAVTREMLLAGHAETMRNGDVILSAELLTRIYRAMAARQPKQRVSWACPVCAASVETQDDQAKEIGE